MKPMQFIALILAFNSVLAVSPDIRDCLLKAYPSSIMVSESWFCDSTKVETIVSADLDGMSTRDYVVAIAQPESGRLQAFLVAIHNLHTKSERVLKICDLSTETKDVSNGLTIVICPRFVVLPPGEHKSTECGEPLKEALVTFKTNVVSVLDCGQPSYFFDGRKYVMRPLACCSP